MRLIQFVGDDGERAVGAIADGSARVVVKGAGERPRSGA